MKKCNNCFGDYQDQYEICPFCGYTEGAPAKELYHLFPGTILADRYIVGQVLGFGGFGITYKAWDAKLETVVAIKEYYPTGIVNRIPGEKDVILFAGNRGKEYRFGLDRFLNEARNMAKFNSHKNIVNVFDFFEENNTAYIIMEFLDGISLSEFLKMNSLDIDTSCELILSISSALKEIHSHGIIHRDVSPDNIYLCLNGNVKLIDFGAARFSTKEEQQMTIILKPGFAPPEQYEKITVQGPWTDVYALGATLYMMVTGQKPEESTNRKVEDTLKAPREVNPNVPENLSNAIMKAMALERHMRFSTMDEFEKAISGEKKIVSLAAERKKRKRKRIFSMLAVASAVVIAGGALAIQYLREKDEETLPQADIALYYALTGDAQKDTDKESAMESVIRSFVDSFPEVSIEPVGVDAEAYWDTVQAAVAEAGSEDTPVAAIFESGSLTQEQVALIGGDVSSLLAEGKETGNCYFFDRYQTWYSEDNQIPMGFQTPMLFCNKTATDYSGTEVADLEELMNALGETKGIAIHADAADAAASVFGSDAVLDQKITVVENADGFVNGEYAFYFAYSDQYGVIQEALPARYAVISLATEQVCARFDDVYSISNHLSADETKVALAFLNYLLSDNAQDNCYIRNWTGTLPLNQNALTLIEDVYSDFSGFFGNIGDYSFAITEVFPEDKIENISIKTKPEKKGYYVGATLNTEGLVLLVTYESGKTEEITEGFVCTPDKLESAGTHTITVTYNGASAFFDVSAIERPVEDAVKSISIKTKPEKKGYYVGAALNTKGLVLLVTYESGKTEEITEGFVCTPDKLETAGTHTITVTYKGATATFDVSAINRDS